MRRSLGVLGFIAAVCVATGIAASPAFALKRLTPEAMQAARGGHEHENTHWHAKWCNLYADTCSVYEEDAVPCTNYTWTDETGTWNSYKIEVLPNGPQCQTTTEQGITCYINPLAFPCMAQWRYGAFDCTGSQMVIQGGFIDLCWDEAGG